jgi:uncharacterized protein DUF5666
MSEALSMNTKRLFGIITLALLAALLLLMARPGGIGGTGIGDGSGGIGGTGLGTGFIGQIDGFGSIWVNGVEIFYDDDMEVSFNDNIGDVSELEIGHVVEVLASPDEAGVYQASSIAVRYEIIGPIQSLNQNAAMVLDQTIMLPDTAENLMPGDMIAVSGFERGDGAIVASRIDRADQDAKPEKAPPLLRPFDGQAEALSLSGYVREAEDGYSLYGYRLENLPQDFAPDRLITLTATPDTDSPDVGRLTIETVQQASEPAMLTPDPVIGPAPKDAPEIEPANEQPEAPREQKPATNDRPENTTPERSEMRPAEPAREDSVSDETTAREIDETSERVEETTPEETRDTQETDQSTADAPEEAREETRDEAFDGAKDEERPEADRAMDAPSRPQRDDRPETVDRPQRPDRPDRPERTDRPERPDRPR